MKEVSSERKFSSVLNKEVYKTQFLLFIDYPTIGT
jgi:hypothetical protein